MTRETLRQSLQVRLGDTTERVWTIAELNDYINFAIKGLYPTVFNYETDSTTAGVGPIQTLPDGCRNLYLVSYQKTGSKRAQTQRGWNEGQGVAFVPRVGIEGDTLIWCWTSGFDAPVGDEDFIYMPQTAEEIILLRSQIAALEKLLGEESGGQALYTVSGPRDANPDIDLSRTIEALRASLKERSDRLPQLPVRLK